MASTNLNSFVANHMKVNLPPEFYCVPDGAKSIFSTRNGTRPKRRLVNPPSPPVLRSDLDTDIRRKAKSLREEFPQVVREISTPLKHWVELYKYFDGVELWTQGASFLFFVMNHISNENAVLDHELESSKNAEIARWAKMWVGANQKRILETSPMQDLVSIFDASEQESIKILTPPQEAILKQELKHNRELLQKTISEYGASVLASTNSNHQICQPDQLAQPAQSQQYHSIQHHPIQQGQPVIGQPYPIGLDPMDPHRAQMMPVRHMPGPVQSYNHFMENQRQLAVSLPLPVGQVDFRREGNSPWERRPRGYSNEATRNIRGGPKVSTQQINAQYNNFGNQSRSNIPFADRRMVSNNTTPRGSPPRRTSQLGQVVEGPIYIHNSQRGSPPFENESTPKASNRGMMQSDQRIFSDPLTGRTGFSNDARLWNASEGRGISTRPQNLPKDSIPYDVHQQHPRGTFTAPQKLSNDFVPFEGHPQALRGGNTRPENIPKEYIPFDGHPQAIFRWTKNPSCTFFYTPEARSQGSDFQSCRTVYVNGVDRDDFESHRLKKMMSVFGQVESVSYLFANTNGGGPAFVTFAHEDSLEPAIRHFNGFQMPSGRALTVNLPHPRSRSGSQSSQRGFDNQHFGFGGTREFQPRPNNHRGSFRNRSFSNRLSDRSTSIESYEQSTFNSSESQKPSYTPLNASVQAQVALEGPVPIHPALEPINASISEVLQKRAALDQLVPHAPLANVENHSSPNKRQNGCQNNRNASQLLGNGEDPVRGGLSQPEMKTKKENSPPKKKGSNKATPMASPQKQVTTPQTGGSNQKSNTGKSRKKGSKQNPSIGQTPQATPAKSSFEHALVSALEKEQRSEDRRSRIAQETDHIRSGLLVESKSHISYEEGQITPSLRAEIKSHNQQEASQDMNESPTDTTLNTEKEIGRFTTTGEVPLDTVDQHGKGSTVDANSQTENSPDSASSSKPKSSSKVECDEAASGQQEESKPKMRKKKKVAKRLAPKSDGGNSSPSMVPSTSNDSFDTTGSSITTESMESSICEPSNHKPRFASEPSESSSCPVSPLKTVLDCDTSISSTTKDSTLDAINDTKMVCHASAASTPKTNNKVGNKQRKSHAKNNSNNSTISNGSDRKADMKSSKGGDKGDENTDNLSAATASRENKKENQPISPSRNVLDDPTHWPALGAPKNPLSNIADGRSPAIPVPRPLTERVKNSNAPIVAIPLNMERRRPSIDSRDWPYVKKCISK